MARRGIQRTVNLTLAALFLAVAAAAAVSFVLQQRVERATADVRRAEVGIVAVLRLSIAVRDAYSHQAHVVILNDTSHVDHYADTATLMARSAAAASTAVAGTRAESALREVIEEARLLDRVFIEQVVPNIGTDKSLRAAAEDAIHRVERMQQRIDEAATVLARDVEDAHSVVEDAATQSRRASAAVLVIAFIVALASALSLERSLSAPLRRLEAATESVARGDLATRIDDVIARRDDELGSLAHRFNAMASALREREARLLDAERLAAVGRVAAGVAHEINNPLGVILGTARLLEKRVDAEGKKDVSTIAAEVERCRMIVGGLLDLARPPRLAATRVDIAELCDETAARLAASDVKVDVNVERTGDAVLEADREKVRQILTNLMTNAAQAGARKVSIVIDGTSPDTVRLMVRDDGRGVPAELAPKLFSPFVTGRADGTGLGLAVSRSIAQAHGGTLEHRPTDTGGGGGGGGAHFELKMPRALKERA